MAKEIMETTIYNEIYKIMSSRDMAGEIMLLLQSLDQPLKEWLLS